MKHRWHLAATSLFLLTLAVGCTSNRKDASSSSDTETPSQPEAKEIKIIPFGTFSSNFNDQNPRHLQAAQSIGIKPINNRKDAAFYHFRLKKIEDCALFDVDSLTHSVPYLVPRAEALLRTIGENFRDSLQSRGVSGYKPIVTSVLRTQEDVRKLRRSNGNASSNSAHCYGTTFDIAYGRFGRTDMRYDVPTQQVKHLLAEVLRNLKREGKCYIKYEVRQGCFHITAR